MIRRLLAAVVAAVAAFSLSLPADAALSPTVNIAQGVPVGGSPGANRTVHGTITLSANDTYVTGGFTLTPQQFGFSNAVAMLDLGPAPGGPYNAAATVAGGVVTVKFLGPLTGTSNVAATATTKVVTPGVTITTNTPILCSLDDAATAGGGTGTWPVTDAVSTCDYTSATTFTITVIAAAPTNGGNFTWVLPNISGEIPAGTSVASVVIPFVASGI